MPRHLTARSRACRWLLLVLVVLPLFSVSALAQSRRDGRPSVTVFVDPNFRGTSETFVGDIADLRDFGLNDQISSIEIPAGEVWEVCQDINFSNRCEVLDRSVSNLAAIGWNDRISSMRRLEGSGLSPRGTSGRIDAEPRLILYAQPGFRGAARVMQDEVRNIGAFANRVASAEVRGGIWELCDQEGWRGNCVAVDQDVSDLSSLGLNGAVVSARPIDDRF